MNTQQQFPNRLLILIWHYLNQPLFDPKTPFIWNPHKFIQNDRVRSLERCWQLDYPLTKKR